MLCSAETRTSGDMQTLSDEDLAEVAKGAAMLPGDWIVGTNPDVKAETGPCAWVHASPSNPFDISVRISKWRNIFLVKVCHHGISKPVSDDGIPYGNLDTAFSTLWGVLMMARENKSQIANLT
jgi:hypothetical protein